MRDVRLWTATALLGCLLAVPPCGAEEPAPLREEEALALVSRGAACSPEAFEALMRFEPGQALASFEEGVPLTLAILHRAVAELPAGRDFRFADGVTPRRVTEALRPAGSDPQVWPSLVQPARARVEALEPGVFQTTGRISFDAPGAFRGVVRFQAVPGPAGWALRTLWFEDPKLEVSTADGRSWFVVTRASEVNPRRGRDLQLPALHAVGPEPDARRRVVISVTRDGDVYVEGEEQRRSLAEVRAQLAARAQHPDHREPDGSSTLEPLLDLDASLPWFVGQWLLQLCADPSVKIRSVAFGATARGSLEAGALRVQLPLNHSSTPGGGQSPKVPKARVVLLSTTTGTTDPRTLHALLRRLEPEVRRKALLELATPPPHGGAVPTGYVLQVLDAARAAGVRALVFEGSALLPGDLHDPDLIPRRIAALRARTALPRIRISKGWVDELGIEPAPLPVHGRTDAPVGFGLPEDAVAVLFGPSRDVFEDLPPAAEKTPARAEDGPAFPRRGTAARERSPRVQQAIERGLAWLAAHQSPSGAWEADTFMDWCQGERLSPTTPRADGRGNPEYEVGLTGLVLQAFLASGQTFRGSGRYRGVVARALRYLKKEQDEEGCFGSRRVTQYTYNHALAAVAMIEAFVMTGSPIVKGSSQRAITFLQRIRNPHAGWRYGNRPGDNDTSITSWMALALCCAQFANEAAERAGQAAPLVIDAAALEGASAWFQRMTDLDYGRVGYLVRGSGPARLRPLVDRFPSQYVETMTAATMFLRSLIRSETSDPDWKAHNERSASLLRALPPEWDATGSKVDFYYWYWGSLAMWQRGGADWLMWEKALHGALLGHQRLEGTVCGVHGSWDPASPWGGEGGRVYATAINVLSLLTPERYPRVR